MTVLENFFEGGTNGAAITAGNSGGDSGSAFDVVIASGTVEYTTAGPLSDSVSAVLTAGVTESPYLRWDSTSWPGASEAWFRAKFEVSDATPAANFTIIAFKEADGSTTGCDVRITTAGKIQLRAPFTERYLSTYTISAGTPFRLEVHVVSSATVGRIEARLFYGANIDGTTPDESFGSSSTNWNTGDGTIAALNVGCTVSPGQAGYVMTLDDVGLGDVAWLGPGSYSAPGPPDPPPAGDADSEIYIGIYGGGDAPDYGGPPPSGGVSSLLVPDSGAWFGATTPALNTSGTSAQGLDEWQAITGFRPHIFPWYKTGAWSGVPTAAELALIGGTGGTPYAIPKYAWKVGSGSGTGSWADVANGVYDTQIDNCAAGVKTYPYTMFLGIFHEPEDNVNTGDNTRAAYRAMWQRIRTRFNAAGVDNVVWFLQYAGYGGHAVNAAGSGFEDLYPGDDYIDWLGMDPYTHSPTRNTLDELVNATQGAPAGFPGWYTWAQDNHPTKPIILGEFGAGNVGCEGASTLGVQFTDAQGAAVVNQWQADLGVTNTAIKAFCYWNGRAVGKYDYQIQRACRTTLYGGAITAMCNDAYFDNDPNLARF